MSATREAEARLGQAISRWEGEKVDRLSFRKNYMAKCSEAQVLAPRQLKEGAGTALDAANSRCSFATETRSDLSIAKTVKLPTWVS